MKELAEECRRLREKIEDVLAEPGDEPGEDPLLRHRNFMTIIDSLNNVVSKGRTLSGRFPETGQIRQGTGSF